MRTVDVSKITPFGLFARYLRGREDETSVEMANRLDLNRPHMTTTELGYNPVPAYYVHRINQTYHMSNEEKDKFLDAIMKSNVDVKQISFMNIPEGLKTEILRGIYVTILNYKGEL